MLNIYRSCYYPNGSRYTIDTVDYCYPSSLVKLSYRSYYGQTITRFLRVYYGRTGRLVFRCKYSLPKWLMEELRNDLSMYQDF